MNSMLLNTGLILGTYIAFPLLLRNICGDDMIWDFL